MNTILFLDRDEILEKYCNYVILHCNSNGEVLGILDPVRNSIPSYGAYFVNHAIKQIEYIRN